MGCTGVSASWSLNSERWALHSAPYPAMSLEVAGSPRSASCPAEHSARPCSPHRAEGTSALGPRGRRCVLDSKAQEGRWGSVALPHSPPRLYIGLS